MKRRLNGVALAAVCLWVGLPAYAADLSVDMVYLRQLVEAPPTLSNLDPVPEDLGQSGAELGLADNLTTGQFLGHGYSLEVIEVDVGGDLIAAAADALAKSQVIIAALPSEALLQVADLPAARDAMIFNALSEDPDVRDAECRANVLHTIPSYGMRADALAQFAVKKRWTKWALIEGEYAADQAFAAALRKAANKFNLKIAGAKVWAFDADMRRNAAQEVPLFTQDLGEYDLLIVADELHDFGRYVAYNTWLPRPVAGSEGLAPEAWSDVVEQWGAAQLQSRFEKLAGRPMQSQDYAAWAAVRAIGEAVTRTQSDDIAVLREFILGPDFELAGFKGRPLSFRAWNGQLRQPIPLVQPRALAANAPIEGFLHQRNELDTLGIDAAESACQAFAGE